ncbi:hypothetical protein A2866_04915 [Candidatus Roizmanbacteria bacterium RIFCSPHIGHO2_01_FULL_39_8]|uniref:Glycosyltransferase RgtA/B/C/D-like domain-containing protein n=1 Tax=Candidatus Roizmanbacteria bacterium RIFCSPHIGHO2_01_FULL_39_8 TaxID=1802033 RepID=A0A1F7GPM7_9BACT|nr:MAG: hypothetical protein A2866_04915 [Candidatus Roizmanbacteria bacterium RIFCSPHIGHO2_01_FULL_39_8]
MFKRLQTILAGKKSLIPGILFFCAVFALFLINSTYVSYPDEFVNLWAGKYINLGKVPYREFFDHHLPLAWYLSAFLLKLSFNSYTLFRFFWALFQFMALFGLAVWIKKNHKDFYAYSLVFLLLYPLVTVYYWLHIFLADSLAAFFFSLIFWILLLETYKKSNTIAIYLVTSFLTFCLIFSSLSYLYLGLVLYLWQVYLLLPKIKHILILVLFSAVPYFFYLLYLLLTNSISDFYFANLTYNTDLYINIANYTRGKFFNPLKFGFTLIYNFWQGYLPRLTTIKDLSLYLPVGSLVTLGSFILLLLLMLRYLPIGILFFFILSFSAPRSNISTSINETDYQVGLYIMLGITASLFVLGAFKKIVLKEEFFQDVLRIGRLLLLLFLLFSFIFLLYNTYSKWYLRYTQKMPSIRDTSDSAIFIDEILDEDDTFWSGPYEPHESFFVKKGRMVGKYLSLLPQFRENDVLKTNFIKQFAKEKPTIIIFKIDTGIFGTLTSEFGNFFLTWLKEYYISLKDVKGVNVLKNPTSIRLDTDLFILKKERDSVLQKLKLYKYIE